MIQKGNGDWVMLCLLHGKIQRFKIKNLERVPALEYTQTERMQMESSVEPSFTSPGLTSSMSTHSAYLVIAGSMSEDTGEDLESSTMTVSSDKEEYGVALRILMDAFVNYLEQALQQNR